MATHPHEQHEHSADLAEVIELEAAALRDLTDLVTRWVAEVVVTPPRHVLDLGSGTGAGTLALLERFPAARVTAVDASSPMLARLEQLADEQGQLGRLSTDRVDLDRTVPVVDEVDLVWASSSLHHLNDPDRLLADMAARLPDHGWCVVVEAEDVPWFLPDDVGIGRPGLERRCHDMLDEHRAAALPDVGADWGARLESAGFAPASARILDIDVPAPLPGPARRYARALFTMFRGGARDRLDAEDLAALDMLLDESKPRGIARRGDLTLRATRRTWAAQRSRTRKDTP